MPQLHENQAAGPVHGLGGELPALHLLVRPDPRRIRIADAQRRHRGGLADDQAGRGALRIVPRHQRARYPLHARSGAGERRHHDAVAQGMVPDFEGIEERGHGDVLGTGSWCCSGRRRQPLRDPRIPQAALRLSGAALAGRAAVPAEGFRGAATSATRPGCRRPPIPRGRPSGPPPTRPGGRTPTHAPAPSTHSRSAFGRAAGCPGTAPCRCSPRA